MKNEGLVPKKDHSHNTVEICVCTYIQWVNLLCRHTSDFLVRPVLMVTDYTVTWWSTFWMMWEKVDVKVVGYAHNKQFRRSVSVPFSMFKDIVEEARDWIGLNGKKLGDRHTDCVGVPGEQPFADIRNAPRIFNSKGTPRTPTQSVSSCRLIQSNLLPLPRYLWT